MNNNQIASALFDAAQNNQLDIASTDKKFYTKLVLHAAEIRDLYTQLYKNHPQYSENLSTLIEVLIDAHHNRSEALRIKDQNKNETWLLSHKLSGMSLYVDQFCGTLKDLPQRLDYIQDLGINFLHLLPVFQSPERESDGGYAVSDFKKVDEKLGTIDDLRNAIADIHQRGMSVMLDIAFNHTSHNHEWAQKATAGSRTYQDFYHFFPDRTSPDLYDQSMVEVFPGHKSGNFTFNENTQQWVMTVFHSYQWDLNYSNPRVFVEMMKNVFFYANLGIDVLAINATQFLWKEVNTSCQNLPQTHTIIQLVKLCMGVVSPGIALANEAITCPDALMKYFGEGRHLTKECDISYNATQMALQWDALATGNTTIMLENQRILDKKPFGPGLATREVMMR
jgi:amylosucrase